MLTRKTVDLFVGVFVLIACMCLFLISIKASIMNDVSKKSGYTVSAKFDEVGSLLKGAPVRIAGVKVGEVGEIVLDDSLFKAEVTVFINSTNYKIPKDSSISIVTDGLLGGKYISISPGFDNQFLKNDDEIMHTNSAILLENIIGKMLFN